MSIITVFNQKGGVGRTTTVLNLLAAIARRGERPLGIDLDPHAQLSDCFAARPQRAEDSVHGFFSGTRSLFDVAQITKSGVMLCPAHPDLARLDASLGKGTSAVMRLREALRGNETVASTVVIDTPRLMNAMTLNALFACDLLIVPISSDFLALDAAREVERTVNALQRVTRRALPRRYLLTRCDEDELSSRVAEQMAASFPAAEICATTIRKSLAVAESPSLQLDVFRHAPDSSGAQDYLALANELSTAGFVAAR
jgi:chromosome partitioning protein